MFHHPEYDNHERVIFARDAKAGLSVIIAIHDTTLGPAFGGCRMWPYADDAAAVSDALRLSRSMTFKAAICGVPLGGGKSVILGDPRTEKTASLLRAVGRVVESLNGLYIIADDVGTTLEDLIEIQRETRHTAARTDQSRHPLAVTAFGVLSAMQAAVCQILKTDLKGLTVAVQGLGNVGFPLCDFLYRHGARLIVTDIDRQRVERAVRQFGAKAVSVEEIYDQDADVFAPCALGSVLNDVTVLRLRAKLICGGANNQLAEPRHGAMLAARGITYVPDYLANAGGVIDYHQEGIDDSPRAVMAAVAYIADITRDILTRAVQGGRTPLEISDGIVIERLAASGTMKTWATAS
jgi:leucine dehydrogenase